jgi:hypothetical protein
MNLSESQIVVIGGEGGCNASSNGEDGIRVIEETCYQNCHGHGDCNGNICTCDDGYDGEWCEIRLPCEKGSFYCNVFLSLCISFVYFFQRMGLVKPIVMTLEVIHHAILEMQR